LFRGPIHCYLLFLVAGVSQTEVLDTPWRTGGGHNGAPVRLHALDAPVAARPAADKLIGAGVTRLGSDKLATVLANLEAGTAPSTIARKLGVGYATVARIAETTKRLQRAGTA
jgi:hypothetical protein